MIFQYFRDRKTESQVLDGAKKFCSYQDGAKKFCSNHVYIMFRFGLGYDWILIHTKHTIMRIRRKNAK